MIATLAPPNPSRPMPDAPVLEAPMVEIEDVSLWYGAKQALEKISMTVPKHRITAYIGPFLLGTVTWWTGSQRLGVATILVFFVVGMLLLLPVREPAHPAQAQ